MLCIKKLIVSPGCAKITNRSQHQTPRGREKWQELTRTKQTNKINAREAHRPAPSSTSEVITILKWMKKHEDREHGKILKHEAPRSKNHKATQNNNNTGGPPLWTVGSINYPEGGGGAVITIL